MEKLFDFSVQGLAETLLPSRITEPTAWVGHIPFAYYLVEKTRPELIVELGVHTGNSFLAFCDAVMALQLDCKCYGVDTFRGDKHAGFYDQKVYVDLMEHIFNKGIDCAEVLQETFDQAVDKFEDNSIDILHIDGCHTYEETRHNFGTWFKKVKDNGFILFHDTMITRDDFGVWKLWQELENHPLKLSTFNFIHSCGLGVLQMNAVGALPRWEFNDPEETMKYFEDLGETIYHEYKFGKRVDRSSWMERQIISNAKEWEQGTAEQILSGTPTVMKKENYKVCLTFICRNNKDTIQRMIRSCASITDCVVACDTGSVDNTIILIRQVCEELSIDCEIFIDLWVNFGVNRTIMMQHARNHAEYMFVMDTDETLEITPEFKKEDLKDDVIMVATSDGVTTYYRDRFFSNNVEWTWIGAAHEFPSGPGAKTKGQATGLNLRLYSKQDNGHIQRNYDLLLKDYEKNPHDSRTLFYLGESAYDLGKNEEALKFFKERSDIPFFPEESWYAIYKTGKTYERMKDFEKAENAYLKAYSRRSTRMEPVYALAYMLAQNNDHAKACIFYDIAMRIPYPNGDVLFVEDYLYRYNCAFYFCISLYYAGRFVESFELAEKVADELKDKMPADVYNRHLLNIMYCEQQLVKQGWRERFIVCPADLRFDGLGDNLLHSHLAGLAKKAGYKKVYLSSLMKFKTPGTKEVVYLNNPDVDGEIERYGLKSEDAWAKSIVCGEVPTHDMEYMKLIALSHGFYKEGEYYYPVAIAKEYSGEVWKNFDGIIFDGYGKTNIVSEEKVKRYFAKFGLPSYQITLDNTDSDVKHSNAGLKRIWFDNVPEINVKNINEYFYLMARSTSVICLTSATAILRSKMDTTVLTETSWLNNPLCQCHMRPYNNYINLDEI
ncbi:MAG: class I SAM-dependent methyltransferase [Parachlamydiales bacterium]|jgi:tetratricopeptide (TPR) repeat protein